MKRGNKNIFWRIWQDSKDVMWGGIWGDNFLFSFFNGNASRQINLYQIDCYIIEKKRCKNVHQSDWYCYSMGSH